MNRVWIARIIGIVVIGILLIVLFGLQSRLGELARARSAQTEASE